MTDVAAPMNRPALLAKPAALLARVGPLGLSLAINFIGPWLVYSALEPHFPSPSPVPLLASAVVPIVEFAVVLGRKKAIDAIAIISMVQLGVSLVITLLAHSPRLAMAGHALQPGALGAVFLGSVLVGRPLMTPLARQALAGTDPAARIRFDEAAQKARPRRIFQVMSLIWAGALIAQSAAQLAALSVLSTKDYLLVANVLGYAVISVLIWASLRYGRHAARRHREEEQRAAAI